MTMKRLVMTAAVAFMMVAPAHAEIAVSITGGGGGTPVADSVHGWEFTVNTDIILTHLGLYDLDLDGFSDDHDIGLFRLGDGMLLTSGTINLVTRGGWAEIYKGKKSLGSTPRRLTLPAGRHRLVLRPFGDGEPRPVFVNVEAGKTKQVSIRLD